MKYKYLYAWDKMMGSSQLWMLWNQDRAKNDNAPLNAVYYHRDDKRWVTLEEVTNQSAIDRINEILSNLGKK